MAHLVSSPGIDTVRILALSAVFDVTIQTLRTSSRRMDTRIGTGTVTPES
jgi:hypothetical protein